MLRIGRRFCNSPVGERVASLKNKKIRGGSRDVSSGSRCAVTRDRVRCESKRSRGLTGGWRTIAARETREHAATRRTRVRETAIRGRAISPPRVTRKTRSLGRAYRARTTYRVTTWRAGVATTMERTGKRENMASTERREKGLNTPETRLNLRARASAVKYRERADRAKRCSTRHRERSNLLRFALIYGDASVLAPARPLPTDSSDPCSIDDRHRSDLLQILHGMHPTAYEEFLSDKNSKVERCG